MDDTTSVSDLLTFLRERNVAVLATVNSDNSAHATSIYYYPEDDLRIYFLTRDGTRKFANVEENRSVAMAITDPVTLQTVQIEGNAVEVDYAHEYAGTVKKLTDSLAKSGMVFGDLPVNHIGQGTSGYFAMVQITPVWVRWSDYRNLDHKVKFEKKFT